ncbi:MAG: family 10 glycosylhydrolase [Actinomycetia bacterium]|nr:family 10 glycosylhydrolase [Actinomycetes bacterium]
MDPANPAAVDYVARAIGSITRNYDVDGINLDYIRYPDYSEGEFRNDWGYSETSLSRFAAETGRSDRPKPTDPEFSQWRRDQVTNLVRKIYLRMYRIDRSDRLSINGITYAFGPQTYGGWKQTRPYTNVLQDWKGWLDEGIIDTVTAMNYKREWMDDQARMFLEWNRALANYRGDRHVVSGPALYLNEIDDAVKQAKQVDSMPIDGWAGYSYANPSKRAAESSDPEVKDSERDALATALREEVFTDDAAVPEMTWKTDPQAGQLSGMVRAPRHREDQLDVRLAPIGQTPGHKRIVRTDGSGWFGVVDLAPGRYRVKVVEKGSRSRTARVRVRAGKVASVDLRVNGLAG